MRPSTIGWNRFTSPREKKPSADQVDGRTQLGVRLVVVRGPIAARLQRVDLGREQAEHEEILGAHFLADLDVGAVRRADGERAVHAELHVAGAGRFLARGGNLLRTAPPRGTGAGRSSR